MTDAKNDGPPEGLMRAASLVASGVIEVRQASVPGPVPGWVVVRMHYASICGSDLHVIFDGFHDDARLGMPGYPGHEGTGVVAAVPESGPGSEWPVGTKVLTVPHGRLGGCFAEYQLVPAEQLIMLPEGADLRQLLPAQQLGTTVFAMKRFLPPGMPAPEVAVIIGAGSAGLFFAQQLRARGSEVIISDLEPARLAIARELGVKEVVLEPEESLIDVTLERTGGRGAELVIDAAGGEAARAIAVEAAAYQATLGAFGYPSRPGSEDFPVERAFRKSLTVLFSNNTQSEPGLDSFHQAVQMIMDGDIGADYCLQALYDLEDAADAVAAARAHGRGAAKIGLRLAAGDPARDH